MTKFIAIAILAAGVAGAHEGPRIWLDIADGVVTTSGSDNDLDPTVYFPQRVFHTELESLFGIQTTEFPGFEVRQLGGNVPSETTFAFDLTGPALFYDVGTDAFVPTAAKFAANAPQIAISLGAELRITSDATVDGFDFFTFHEVGDHSHLAFTMLGDGTTPVDGPQGVYAITLSFSAATVEESPDVYLLIGNGVEHDDPVFEGAIAAAERIVGDCVGDLNHDGSVGLTDLSTLLAGFGTTSGAARDAGDLSGDGAIDLTDLAMLLAVFGLPCS